MNQTRKKGSGGAREGSGRKRYNLSDKSLKDLESSFRKAARESQTSAGKELAKLAFGSENERIKLKALEIYYNVSVTKRTETTIDDKREGPRIGLPPVMERPKPKEEEQERVLHG